MAIDPRIVDAAAESVAAVYREAETALIAMLSRRLAQGLDEPDWALRRLAEISGLRRAAELLVDELDLRGTAAMRQAIATAYAAGRDDAVVELAERLVGDVGPWARGADFRNGSAIQALADAAVRELRPLHRAILPQALDAYRRAIAGASARYLAGVQTRREAAQSAWSALVAQGITGYLDSAGRRWRLHSYVEMATRTTAHRAAVQGLIDGFETAGQRLVYVPDLPGECALCRPWEHRILALWGDAGPSTETSIRSGRPITIEVAGTLEEARLAGLLHPNCRHLLRPYVPGMTRLAPGRAADPQGDADRQRQRAIERHLRHWREQEAAALTREAQTRASARVQAWDAEMGRHIEETGLRRLRHREQIGAGYEAPEDRRGDRADLEPAGRPARRNRRRRRSPGASARSRRR